MDGDVKKDVSFSELLEAQFEKRWSEAVKQQNMEQQTIKLTPDEIDAEVMRQIPKIQREKECMVTKMQREYDRNVLRAELIRKNKEL